MANSFSPAVEEILLKELDKLVPEGSFKSQCLCYRQNVMQSLCKMAMYTRIMPELLHKALSGLMETLALNAAIELDPCRPKPLRTALSAIVVAKSGGGKTVVKDFLRDSTNWIARLVMEELAEYADENMVSKNRQKAHDELVNLPLPHKLWFGTGTIEFCNQAFWYFVTFLALVWFMASNFCASVGTLGTRPSGHLGLVDPWDPRDPA